jgi:hypothetical protein
MKKKLISFLVALSLALSSFVVPTTTYAVAGAYCNQPGQCGTQSEGCDAGEVCEDTIGWGGTCAASNGRCDNRDASRAEICGFTNSTDGWCNDSGGCAQGYLCNGTKQICELSDGTTGAPGGATCKNIQLIYNKQCGWATANQCGNDGACEYGYRCVSVASTVSRTGYACRPDPAGTANKCPESPSTPPEVLACGQSSTNPNVSCSCPDANPDNKPITLPGNKYCCGWKVNGGADCSSTEPSVPMLCGQTTSNSTATCRCVGANLVRNTNVNATTERDQMYCCGWIDGKNCSSTEIAPNPGDPSNPNPPPAADPNSPVADPDNSFNIFQGPNSQDFNNLNPLKSQGTASINDVYFTSPGGVISRVLLFAFPIAGLILFIMLVWAGFQILMGAFQGGSKAIDAGKQRATTALIGFLLLFVSYWIMQIIETIFSITIL